MVYPESGKNSEPKTQCNDRDEQRHDLQPDIRKHSTSQDAHTIREEQARNTIGWIVTGQLT
jgi:hypothetical protein